MSVKLRSKRLSNGSQSLYLDIYYRGVRNYEFLDIKIIKNDPHRKHKKELAEAKRSKRELELIANHHDIPKNFNGDDDFIEYFQSKAISDQDKSVLNKFKSFIKENLNQENLPFKFLSEKLINEYKGYLEKILKNSTAWAYLLKLKTILNKAVKENLISKSPAKNIRIKLNDIPKVYLSENELKALIKADCQDIEVKKAFLFSCFTGLRISDVKKIIWSQIQENKLNFRQTKTKGFEYLPLSITALKFLYLDVDKKKIQLEERIFKLVHNKRVNTILRSWAKEAKIDKYLTFHSARHTFATMSLNSGIDIYTVSKMLGHKSIKNTEIYAKIVNKTMERAVTRLPIL